MNIQETLNLSLNDDDGHYNFVLKNENILSISIDKIDVDTANEIFDGISKAMEITLSVVVEQTNGMVSLA